MASERAEQLRVADDGGNAPSCRRRGAKPRNLEDLELLNTRSQLRRAAGHAYDYYRGAIPLEQCQSVVDESYQLLGRSAQVRHHLVGLADRWSIERLRRVGVLQRRLGRSVPEVLFVDIDDSGVAATTAALIALYGRGRANASSAGQEPAAALDPTLVRVAADLDVDLTEAFPKVVTSEALQVADVVVTLGEATAGTDGADTAGPATDTELGERSTSAR